MGNRIDLGNRIILRQNLLAFTGDADFSQGGAAIMTFLLGFEDMDQEAEKASWERMYVDRSEHDTGSLKCIKKESMKKSL
mgnify:FL=1